MARGNRKKNKPKPKPKMKPICCNPLKKKHHQVFLRVFDVTHANILNAKKCKVELKMGQKMCESCRNVFKNPPKESVIKSKKIQASPHHRDIDVDMDIEMEIPQDIPESQRTSESQDTSESQETSGSQSTETDSDQYFNENIKDINVEKVKTLVNKLLKELDTKMIDGEKMRSKNYQLEKMKKINDRLIKVLFPQAKIFNDCDDIIDQLKKKFRQTTDRNLRIKILSIIPKEWSVATIQGIFGDGASRYLIERTKNLVKTNGILCDATKRIASHTIAQNIIDKAIAFYRSESMSRACPGMRDYAPKNVDGEVLQRRLILWNLKEVYELFKEEHPDHKIGFSKFASVRPGECVLAGSAHGIHTTCVCVYHQNVKLIFDSLKGQFNLREENINTYRDFMDRLVCDDYNEECRLNECRNCPGIDGTDSVGGLRAVLFRIIDDEMYENISFKQWVSAGSKYIKIVKYSPNIENFILKPIFVILYSSWYATTQS